MRHSALALLAIVGITQAAPMQNLALNAKVTASSHHLDYVPEKVVDGVVDNESRWISASGAGPHTLTIELPGPAAIGCVQLLSGWAPEGRWIHAVQNFRFEARANGLWEAIPGAAAEDNQRHGWEVRLKTPVAADAIRLVAMDQGYVRVAEVRVFLFSDKGDYPGVLPPAKPDVRTGTLSVSGIYPHLAAFNHNGECGIGAVVSWADRLWYLTYPPHARQGSSDRLYEVAPDMSMTVRPESVGGTHANRLIHRESNQLIMGPYFIDADRNVRVANLRDLAGRLTATTRHLTNPANKVYFYDMEGPVYEVDVHSLAVNKLFHKPVPGWHGKGAYVGQGRFIVSNNGENHVGGFGLENLLAGGPPKSPEDAGVLAQWDGKDWSIVERRQFTDITGPGGIYGAPDDDQAPVWAMGWDKRSVILKVLADGTWSTYRVPKGSYAFDPKHGWYTEWPRIREVFPDRFLMVMHGTMFGFPKTFGPGHTGGLHPVATHLRYIPDFCGWNGKLVLAADDTSVMQNALAGQSQSNLWFGTWEALSSFGPRVGFGGVWVDDAVKADVPSDPLLVAGYGSLCLHLRNQSDRDVQLTVERDQDGTGQWASVAFVSLAAHSYKPVMTTDQAVGAWLRLRSDRDATLTAYAHLGKPAARPEDPAFAALSTGTARSIALLRPSGHSRNLQVLSRTVGANGTLSDWQYQEVDETLAFQTVEDAKRAEEMEKLEAIKPFSHQDELSVFVTRKGQRYRLPSVVSGQDPAGPVRDLREVQSERFLLNAGGLLYEMPRDDGVPRLRPVCAHGRRIYDFCTWRGLLAVSGCRPDAKPDGHYFGDGKGTGLWFGAVDDLWRLGKPVGRGYVWRGSEVTADAVSDPFLATGFDRKRLVVKHDSATACTFVVECDFLTTGDWQALCEISVPAGKPLTYEFDTGFAAHWLRLRARQNCMATAEFIYQ